MSSRSPGSLRREAIGAEGVRASLAGDDGRSPASGSGARLSSDSPPLPEWDPGGCDPEAPAGPELASPASPSEERESEPLPEDDTLA